MRYRLGAGRDVGASVQLRNVTLADAAHDNGGTGVTRTDVVRQISLFLGEGCGCTVPVAMAMTRNVTYCCPGDLLQDVWSIMKERKLLHIPIVGKDFRPLGVINARDALLVLLETSEHEGALLREYIMGIGYH
jgi:predicted transcriptional regulator